MLSDYSDMQLPSLSLSKPNRPSDCTAAKGNFIFKLTALVKTSMSTSNTDHKTLNDKTGMHM